MLQSQREKKRGAGEGGGICEKAMLTVSTRIPHYEKCRHFLCCF